MAGSARRGTRSREYTDDLQVGRIISTQSNVFLSAPKAIVDQLNDSGPGVEADVTGVNITMTAGTGLVSGGIGTQANFLEINVDVLNGTGVLNAWDRLAPTAGIFLTETKGDLKVDTVWTTADVSLVTLAGSVVDARAAGAGDAEANVFGTNIDIDANRPSLTGDLTLNGTTITRASGSFLSTDLFIGELIVISGAGSPYDGTYTIADITAFVITLTTSIAASSTMKTGVTIAGVGGNIGNPSGGNDLEIESSHGTAGDVGLEADGSIYVTETRGTLHLALAEALGGDIRLTVRETAAVTGTAADIATGTFTGSVTLRGRDADARRAAASSPTASRPARRCGSPAGRRTTATTRSRPSPTRSSR